MDAIESIEERLRERARLALDDELERTLRPMRNLIRSTRIGPYGGKSAEAEAALAMVEDVKQKAMEQLLPRRINTAIAEFIGKVDSIGEAP